VTPEQLAEWAALTDAATMGPWEVRRLSWPQDSRDASDIVSPFGVISDAENMPKAADAAFIAAARAAVPALIAEVQRLRAAVKYTEQLAERELYRQECEYALWDVMDGAQ